jgi:hypothetical protein
LLCASALVLAVLGAFVFGVWRPPTAAQAASVSTSKQKITCLNLQGKANHKLKDDFHGTEFVGNNLPLAKGEKTLGGVKFAIGDGLIQLGSQKLSDKPLKVEGLEVARSFERLHILHATGWRAPEGTVIATYTVRYEDKTSQKLEIAYGKDVRDWWDSQDINQATRSKVVWEGVNAASQKAGGKIRLFLTTWKNPQPKKKVLAIDIETSGMSDAAPFCVAMTMEEK